MHGGRGLCVSGEQERVATLQVCMYIKLDIDPHKE